MIIKSIFSGQFIKTDLMPPIPETVRPSKTVIGVEDSWVKPDDDEREYVARRRAIFTIQRIEVRT